MNQSRLLKVLLLAAMFVFVALSLPLREVHHSKDLARSFGQLAQLSRDGSWEEAALRYSALQDALVSIPEASVSSHWRSERVALLTQEILSPLQDAIAAKSTTRTQEQIAKLSLYCTQCHQRQGRPDLVIRKRPTASNVIGE